MPKEKTIEEKIENLICKIYDFKCLIVLIANADFDSITSDDMSSVMNSLKIIILDIEEDIHYIQEKLNNMADNKTVL